MSWAIILSVALSGCATAPGWQFADEPGIPVTLSVRDQGAATGSLVGFENGSFVFERTYDRSENVEVIRVDGKDYVYVRGVVVGTAVEIRDFDIVTRQLVSPGDVGSVDVKTRAYAGWGSVVAGILTFFLVMVLEDA